MVTMVVLFPVMFVPVGPPTEVPGRMVEVRKVVITAGKEQNARQSEHGGTQQFHGGMGPESHDRVGNGLDDGGSGLTIQSQATSPLEVSALHFLDRE
jgi:hypothetical protein